MARKTLYEPFVFRRLIIGVNWSMLTHVLCQRSGSGCSPNSSTHCSVQGRICPCKNGSMNTLTTCDSPRSIDLPSSTLNSDPFCPRHRTPGSLGHGHSAYPKKRSSFQQQWVHQNSLWAHGCMVNPFQVSVQDLKQPEVTQNRAFKGDLLDSLSYLCFTTS